MDTLNTVQLQYFKELFDVINKEHEVSITYKELGAVFRALGGSPSDLDVQDMINAADVDGNGTLDFSEFAALLVRKMCDTSNPDELRDAFHIIDKDRNGFISAGELRTVYIALGIKISDDELDELIREADMDQDGVVTLDDFVYMMTGSD